jgi:hypothetical protein
MNEQQLAAVKLALEYLKLQKQYGPAIAYGNTTIDECIAAIKKVLVAEFVADFTEQPAQQDVPETNFGNMAQPDYAWPTIEDYEKEVGFKVNDAFKAAWTMARTTNDLFKQMGEST